MRLPSSPADMLARLAPLGTMPNFAQFEREVIGERVHDKIAASHARRMWMGGFVPLGYDVRSAPFIGLSTADGIRMLPADGRTVVVNQPPSGTWPTRHPLLAASTRPRSPPATPGSRKSLENARDYRAVELLQHFRRD